MPLKINRPIFLKQATEGSDFHLNNRRLYSYLYVNYSYNRFKIRNALKETQAHKELVDNFMIASKHPSLIELKKSAQAQKEIYQLFITSLEKTDLRNTLHLLGHSYELRRFIKEDGVYYPWGAYPLI